MNDDPYEVLGIGREASAKDIRQRYLALARRYHPDVNGGDGTAEWVFKHIQHAYESLRGHDGASGPAPTGRPRSRREPIRANRNGNAEHDGDGPEPREYWKHRREERRGNGGASNRHGGPRSRPGTGTRNDCQERAGRRSRCPPRPQSPQWSAPSSAGSTPQ